MFLLWILHLQTCFELHLEQKDKSEKKTNFSNKLFYWPSLNKYLSFSHLLNEWDWLNDLIDWLIDWLTDLLVNIK